MTKEDWIEGRKRMRSGNSALTEAQVRIIKERLRLGTPRRTLAQIYHIALETIARIDRGDTWGWVDIDEIPPDLTQEELVAPIRPDQAQDMAQILENLRKRGVIKDEPSPGMEKLQAVAKTILKPLNELDELMKENNKEEKK